MPGSPAASQTRWASPHRPAPSEVGHFGPVCSLTTLSAPVVVSSADIKHTFLNLLEADLVPRSLRRRVREYEISLPLGIAYAVIGITGVMNGGIAAASAVLGRSAITAVRA